MKPKRNPVAKLLNTSSATRRNNLRALIGPDKRFASQAALASTLLVTDSYLSQMIGPNPIRRVSETTARKFEHKLKLAVGALDVVVVR